MSWMSMFLVVGDMLLVGGRVVVSSLCNVLSVVVVMLAFLPTPVPFVVLP